MSEKFFDIQGHTVSRYDVHTSPPVITIWNIPALIGRDTDRKRGRVEITFPLHVTEEGPVRGWGDIDCDRSYRIDYGAIAPLDLIHALAELAGGEIRVDED